MEYNLFLDDIRTIQMIYPTMDETEFIIVRTYDDFINTIIKSGLPNFISFDNDLRLDNNGNAAKEGYDCAKWLVYESGFNLMDLKFNVHSANPIAKIQIEGLLSNYKKHLLGLQH